MKGREKVGESGAGIRELLGVICGNARVPCAQTRRKLGCPVLHVLQERDFGSKSAGFAVASIFSDEVKNAAIFSKAIPR
jgi:hypothetical protein